jgi:very-short-patch-repair endonuclease
VALFFVVFAFAAQHAKAQGVQKWQTPNGTIYFGDKPPPGSSLLGVIDIVEPTPAINADRGLRGQAESGPKAVHGYDLVPVVVMILLAVGGLVRAIYWRRSKSPHPPTPDANGGTFEPWPFYLKRPLSQPEQVLYHRLRKALPEHIVLAQVQLSRFLGVKHGHSFRWWNNRINRLSADFLVCAKDSSVVAAIELDESSHDSKLRRSVDARKDQALASAGVKLLRWRTTILPDEEIIRRSVLDS